MKVEDEDLNVKELEEAEYEEGQFQKYDGEIPPTGTMLNMRVTAMWWTYTAQDGDAMLKVLSVAEDNPGSLSEYDGLPCWDNMALTAAAKFKWAPFLDHFGLTIRQVKTQLFVADDDDRNGAPIEKIAKWQVGSDAAQFVGVINKERYQGKWQAHINEWLDADTELEADEEEEKSRSRAAADGGRGRRSKPAATRGRRSRDEDEEPEEVDDEEEEAPKNRSRSQRGATSRSKTKAAPARRGSRNRSRDEEDEPPF